MQFPSYKILLISPPNSCVPCIINSITTSTLKLDKPFDCQKWGGWGEIYQALRDYSEKKIN